jgi:predicted DNA-binding transcriptional regulator AlpA
MTQAAYTVDEWCTRRRLCRASFYKLLKQGKAPRTYYVGNRQYISAEADADWQAEREADSSRAAQEVAA